MRDREVAMQPVRNSEISAKRILITQKFASLGGSQVSLVHHVKLLDRSRFEPHVVVSNTGWLTTRLDELGIGWTHANFVHWTNPLSAFSNLRLIWKLRRVIHEKRIDLVHANEHWVGPPSLLAARWAGIPVVCHFRTGLEDLTRPRVYKYLYGRFDRVMVVAEVLRKALAPQVRDRSRIVVVRDGVEPGPAKPHYRRPTSRRIIINVGAIYAIKGQAKILVRSLRWLKASRFNYLAFVGGTRTAPSYFELMKDLVAKHDLQKQVLFLGSREDVPRLLAIADALVAYSTVEGVPRVVMEAMFAGRPVIVSNTPGMEEVVVDGEVGRIADFETDEEAFADVLRDFSERPERWTDMGQKAFAHAVQRYSTQAMSAAIQSIYSELLEQPDHAQAKP
jgi:glycosyltransferase involved in cell wall biosynthesis